MAKETDYFQSKFIHLLQKAGRVRDLQKLGKKRGYLTIDEKQRLYRVQQELDKMIDLETEELKRSEIQSKMFH